MTPNEAVQSAFPLIGDHLVDATVDLFKAYDVIAQPLGELKQLPDESESATAIIGYGGNKVRGALILLASAETIESWNLSRGGGMPDACDSLGEFSNMLLGALKSRLVRRGLPIYLSLPTTALVRQLRLAPSEGVSRWMAFDGPDGGLKVRVDAVFEDGFELSDQPEHDPAQAGEVLLF